jgi:hypothetical protein
MSTITCLLIPANNNLPVREVEYDNSDYKNLTALIFDGDRTGTFDRMSVRDEESGDDVTFWFDDDGLARLDSEDLADIVNLRAMELFAFLAGYGTQPDAIQKYGVPLVGDYVLTGGADEEGDSLPYPGWLKEYPFTWPAKIGIRRNDEASA